MRSLASDINPRIINKIYRNLLKIYLNGANMFSDTYDGYHVNLFLIKCNNYEYLYEYYTLYQSRISKELFNDVKFNIIEMFTIL